MTVDFSAVSKVTNQRGTNNPLKLSKSSKTSSRINKLNEGAAIRLENEFIFREKTMASNLLAIEQVNAFLIDLLKRLQQLNQKSMNKSVQSGLLEIIELIQSQINNKSWDHFECFYKLANNNFIQNLTAKHPNLSPSEKRLCMLLQMNLSTKEISDITMQSCRAIEMARHRLRTKFELSREDNIQSYLDTLSQ